MRLIDAEALKEYIYENFDGIQCYDGSGADIIGEVNEIIDDTPTIASCAEPQVIHCKDCKYQRKYWHEDKRMKEKGYWIYGCELIGDHFIGTPVWGEDNQFCSSAEQRGNENDSRTNT